MTDSEIFDALERHSGMNCLGCPYFHITGCGDVLHIDALDLANRQQAEIERLKKELNEYSDCVDDDDADDEWDAWIETL